MEPLFRDSGLKLVRIAPDLAGIPRAWCWKKPEHGLGKSGRSIRLELYGIERFRPVSLESAMQAGRRQKAAGRGL